MFQVSTSEQDAKQGLGSNKIGGLGLYLSLETLMIWTQTIQNI